MKIEFCPAFNPIIRDADTDHDGINDGGELNSGTKREAWIWIHPLLTARIQM